MARGGGDYSRKAITLNISVKGGRLIEGLLFEEIRELSFYILVLKVIFSNVCYSVARYYSCSC